MTRTISFVDKKVFFLNLGSQEEEEEGGVGAVKEEVFRSLSPTFSIVVTVHIADSATSRLEGVGVFNCSLIYRDVHLKADFR